MAIKAFGLSILRWLKLYTNQSLPPRQVKVIKQWAPTNKFLMVPIMLDGNNLKDVKSLIYLVSKVNANASLYNEIINCILKAMNAFENFIIISGMKEVYY